MKIKYLVYCAIALVVTFVACGSSQPTPAEATVDMSILGVATEQPAESVQPADEEPAGDYRRADHIIISKQTMTLSLYDDSRHLICRFPIAVGKNLGNKRRVGDMKTPEGEFTVQQIQLAAHWTHDFGDGKGVIEHCYGNWFIRLKTPPHKGIGIHGTHAPESIGTRATEGCIRLKNSDLDSLKPMVKVGMRVVVESSEADRMEDARIDGKTVTEEKPMVDVKPRDVVEDAEAESGVAEPDKRVAHSGEVWHEIVSGDMLGALAIKYDVSVTQIRELNPGLNERNLQLGQRIRIK